MTIPPDINFINLSVTATFFSVIIASYVFGLVWAFFHFAFRFFYKGGML